MKDTEKEGVQQRSSLPTAMLDPLHKHRRHPQHASLLPDALPATSSFTVKINDFKPSDLHFSLMRLEIKGLHLPFSVKPVKVPPWPAC